jgi:hypothetical protein
MNKIESYLIDRGLNPSHKGFYYIEEVLADILKNQDNLFHFHTRVEKQKAEQRGLNLATYVRNINHEIKRATGETAGLFFGKAYLELRENQQ